VINRTTFRRILCALDLSDFSPHVLGHAVALARWSGATLAVVHVARAPDFRLIDAQVLDAAERERRLDALRRLVDGALETSAARLVLRQGDTAHEIAEEAAASAADLLVVGTHGRRGLDHWELGSVAEDVIRRAPCPVLTVPRGSRPAAAMGAPFRSVVCALDLGPSSAATLEAALSLSIRSQAATAVVHVLEDVPEEASRMRLRLGAPWFAAYRDAAARQAGARLHELLPEEVRSACAVEEFLLPGKPSRRIVRLAREREADLVVMGAHGARPMQVTLFGSTAAKVVRESACPVLTVPPRVRVPALRALDRLSPLPLAR
jgi:nucleotide-binding universal stress UspA family protein